MSEDRHREVRDLVETALQAASVAVDGKDALIFDWLTVCCFMTTDETNDNGSPSYGYMVLHSEMLPHVQIGLAEYASTYTQSEHANVIYPCGTEDDEDSY